MAISIESITTAALSAALDSAALRHVAVASNIANVHTEGYSPLEITFDARLQDAKAALREKEWLDAGMVGALRGVIQPSGTEGEPVSRMHLDLQMAELARNSVQFQVLTQAISRHLGMLALAAGDGRK